MSHVHTPAVRARRRRVGSWLGVTDLPCLLLFALGAILLVGCGRRDSARPPPHAAERPGAEAALFTGVITGRQGHGSPGSAVRVTCWVGRSRIRREVSPERPPVPGTAADTVAGVICDATRGTAIVYRAKGTNRHFVALSMPEYLRFCRRAGPGMPEAQGIGTIFAGLPPKEYAAHNTPRAGEVLGHLCDRLVINHGSVVITVIEADHDPEIRVPRALLGLVELDLPAELTGFPIVVRRVEGLRTPAAAAPDASTIRRFFRRAAELASEGLQKTTERKHETLDIVPGEPDDAVFEPPPDHTRLPNLAAFDRVFFPQETGKGSSHAWDDWD